MSIKANTLYRLTIKPDSQGDVNPFELCLKRNVIGTGWGICDPVPETLDEYERRGREAYPGRGFVAMVHALRDMKLNDLVWTRRPWSSDYYLCRVIGDWTHESSHDCDSADIHNLIPVEFVEIDNIDLVPGKVVNSFRSRSTLQRIHADRIGDELFNPSLEMSMRIYNMKGQAGAIYDVKPVTDEGILQLLLPEDVEELVSLYLQVEHDYLLYSSSNKIYTAEVEYEMVKRDGSKRCYTQVKTGGVTLDPKDYAHLVNEETEVFLYSTCPFDDDRSYPGVTVITNDQLVQFMRNHREILPRRIKWWLEQQN